MSNVGIKLKLDASEAVSAANATKDAFLGMADAMAKATEAGDWEAVNKLATGMNKVGKSGGDLFGQGGSSQAMRNVTPGGAIVSAANQVPGTLSTLGRGDFAGAAVGGIKQAGSMTQQAGGMIKEDSSLASLAPVLKTLGVAGLVTGALLAGANVLSEQWEKVMEPAMKVGAMLNDTAASLEDGSAKIRSAFSQAAGSANKFGYSATEGLQVVEDLARYGAKEESGIYDIEEDVFSFERGTGASRSNLTKLAGSQFRYTGETQALETAYGGVKASGMEKGQFDEFLVSIQRVFEDGVSKGIIKGADEIAGNLSFLSRVSGGNPLWQGENAAQKITQMSNATAGATSLSNVTDILSYRAAAGMADNYLVGDKDNNEVSDWKDKFGSERGNDYVDNMLILEGGFSSSLLKAQRDKVTDVEGEDNRTGIIERYRSMFGLNYTGSAQLHEMIKGKDDEWFKDEKNMATVVALTQNPEFKSNEVKMLSLTEEIATNMATIGQKFMGAKMGLLEPINEAIQQIRQKMMGTQGLKGSDATIGLFSGAEWNSHGKEVGRMIDKGLTSDNPETASKMIELATYLTGVPTEERDILNRSNYFNVATQEELFQKFQDLQTNGLPKLGGIGYDTMKEAAENSAALRSTNWQTKEILPDLFPALSEPESLSTKITDMLQGFFKTQAGIEEFFQSKAFEPISGLLRNNADPKSQSKFSEAYILKALDNILKAYSGIEDNNKVSAELKNYTLAMQDNTRAMEDQTRAMKEPILINGSYG